MLAEHQQDAAAPCLELLESRGGVVLANDAELERLRRFLGRRLGAR